MVLGFVLGQKVELYLWLSVARYDMDWITRPGVLMIAVVVLATLIWPFWNAIKQKRMAAQGVV